MPDAVVKVAPILKAICKFADREGNPETLVALAALAYAVADSTYGPSKSRPRRKASGVCAHAVRQNRVNATSERVNINATG